MAPFATINHPETIETQEIILQGLTHTQRHTPINLLTSIPRIFVRAVSADEPIKNLPIYWVHGDAWCWMSSNSLFFVFGFLWAAQWRLYLSVCYTIRVVPGVVWCDLMCFCCCWWWWWCSNSCSLRTVLNIGELNRGSITVRGDWGCNH